LPESIGPPPGFYLLLEARLAAEASALMLQLPMLRLLEPTGSGPVLVLPGFMADDNLTWLLRRFLEGQGYRAYPWGLGVNRGPMMQYLPTILESLERICDRHGAAPSVVGWSRGGVLAREAARDCPRLVRSIVTLGSPVRGGVHGTSIGRWVAQQTGMTPEQMRRILAERQGRLIETPITAIYSKTDGVVAWQACVDESNPQVTHVEVASSHMGLVVNAAVYRETARALAARHGAKTGR
jgi:pimeloyl-ACP methyl ester carboxylesterase